LIFGSTVIDNDILPLEIAAPAQAFSQRRDEVNAFARRSGMQKPHHRHRRLLRARREWPRRRRAAAKQKEFAPSYA
jgi:hypothetical protein